MPHYFFDVHDGIDVVDEVGQDLPDIDAAKREAIRIAGDFASDPRMLGEDGGALVIVIRDAPDVPVLTVRLAFSIKAAREFQLGQAG